MYKEIDKARPKCAYCKPDQEHPDGVLMKQYMQGAGGNRTDVWWQCPACGSRSPVAKAPDPFSVSRAQQEAYKDAVVGRRIAMTPLQRDVARALDRNTILWIERRPNESDEYPPLEIWVRVGGYKGSITIYFDGCVGLTTEDEIDWDSYGIEWRAWLACPEDEHRYSAPWKERC